MAGSTSTLSVDISNSLLTTVTWTAYYANTTDTFGTLASPTRTQIATGTFTVSSTLTRYSAQISIPAAATTGIEVVLTVGAQTSGTWVVGNIMLEESSIATSFDYRPYGTELALCQRYFETVGKDGTGSVLLPNGCATAASQQVNATLVYKVTKRDTPQVTKVGTWTMTNMTGQPNVTFAGVDSVLFYANATAAGQAFGQNIGAGLYVTIAAEL
jgi:hypothetical protein